MLQSDLGASTCTQELREIKNAGYPCKSLSRKAGFTLVQLREAGFPAAEVRTIEGHGLL